MRLRAIHVKDTWWRNAGPKERQKFQAWVISKIGLCAVIDYYPESPWAGFTIRRPHPQ